MVRLWSLSPRPPALFGLSVNRMLGTESGIGLLTEDVWETLVGLLDRFGRAAEDHAARFDVGISPNDRGEFLVRDDAGLVGRPARRRGLDVPRSGSTLRPLPPSAHRPHRRNGRTRGRRCRPHGTGARWPGTHPGGGDTGTPRTSGFG